MSAACFVQIPSYRDRELPATLCDLFKKAAHPDRLRVCVAWQYGEGETLPAAIVRRSNVEIIATPARMSQGPNWARRRLQSLYRDEPYTLFLDAHHRFVDGWDDRVLKMFLKLKRSGIEKPLITAYLPPYDPSNDPRGRSRELLKIYPLKRTRGLLTHLTGRKITLWRWLKKPIAADFLSLHFVFCEGRFNRDILLDPNIYFFGDEVFIGLRAFCAGYDLYHPHQMIGWHVYDRATRIPHWEEHPKWQDLEERSFERMRRIIEGRLRPRGYFSSERSVQDYQDHIGITLMKR